MKDNLEMGGFRVKDISEKDKELFGAKELIERYKKM